MKHTSQRRDQVNALRGRTFYRPRLEILEDRLCPGDTILGMSLFGASQPLSGPAASGLAIAPRPADDFRPTSQLFASAHEAPGAAAESPVTLARAWGAADATPGAGALHAHAAATTVGDHGNRALAGGTAYATSELGHDPFAGLLRDGLSEGPASDGAAGRARRPQLPGADAGDGAHGGGGAASGPSDGLGAGPRQHTGADPESSAPHAGGLSGRDLTQALLPYLAGGNAPPASAPTPSAAAPPPAAGAASAPAAPPVASPAAPTVAPTAPANPAGGNGPAASSATPPAAPPAAPPAPGGGDSSSGGTRTAGGATAAPPDLVVGRTLSSYTVAGVQNNQLTVTYTVYNQQADPLTGVLLTDTLLPGVTYLSASAQPDQSGPLLAWSLGTVGGFDRASVTLTVALASPVPTQLDGGAHAFGTLHARAVTNDTPAAVLGTSTIAAALLASTPDANTTDPFVQEQAAKLRYDPQQIFSFLQTQVGYNSYAGSLRGARGTLWSHAGNSLDVASLGVALMRVSGIPAQYAQGTLSQTQAQQLILSMFPASFQTVGYIAPGTQLADPAHDPQLLAETTAHYWFQFDAGSGMQDADPLMASAQVGQSFAASTGTFPVVADNLRQKTEVKLTAEIYSAASAAFGDFPLTNTVVLDQTFNDVDLVGRPLSVGHVVSQDGGSFGISTVINTYTPHITLGDEAFPDPNHDETITGQPYQELLTNFPLGSQILTGSFLDITLSGPNGAPQTYGHTILDRFGYAARQGQGTAHIAVDTSSPPAFTEFDTTAVNVMASLQPLGPLGKVEFGLLRDQDRLSQGSQTGQTYDPSLNQAIVNTYIDLTRFKTLNFAALSDHFINNLAKLARSRAYFDSPRLTILSARTLNAQQDTAFAMDVIRETVRAVPSPAENAQAANVFNVVLGYCVGFVERSELPAVTGQTPLNVPDIISAALAQGARLRAIGSDNLFLLDTLDLSAEAKGRITAAVQQGALVAVPDKSPVLNGAKAIGWYQIDLRTGALVDVFEDGSHASLWENIVTWFKGPAGRLAAQEARITAAEAELAALRATITRLQVAVGGLVALEVKQRISAALSSGGGLSAIIAAFRVHAHQDESTFLLWHGAFELLAAIIDFDPPITSIVSDIDLDQTFDTDNLGRSQTIVAASGSTGNTTGTATVPNVAASLTTSYTTGSATVPSVAASGQLNATWSSSSTSTFPLSSDTTSLSAASATVRDASGNTVGTGAVERSSGLPIPVSIAGNNQYSVTGSGSLSLYGQAPSPPLGVSGNWTNYSATVTGNVSLTLTTGYLTLNGLPLRLGTYTVTTSSATLSGSGSSNSPDFSGSASINATGAAITLGAGSGNVIVGGNPLDLTNGATLTGYTGAITAAAAGGSTHAVTLSGTAATSGQLAATWSTSSTGGFPIFSAATSLSAASATIRDANGNTVGTGAVARSGGAPAPVSIAGNNNYSVSGVGSLSFYGPAESPLGVSGNWTSYSATVTGNVSLTLTTSYLTLNGQPLPGGTYTVTTSSATLAGSGSTTSPNFAGSASLTATGGTINLGPGSGNVTVAGNPLDLTNGATLTNYTGTLTVAAGGGSGTDAVTLNGTAGNVLRVSASPATLTTDQNTPATFHANVQTSLADTYTLTAKAPPGWKVSIDNSQNVTVTPAPGLQGGTCAVQLIAQSTIDPDLVAQTTVNVTVTPTQPGITFNIVPDTLFTVPYNDSELPTAFQGVIHNNGPTADTYNLTISNVPSGFTLLNSGTTVTVPAGQTGIVGIYLQPTTGPLPAPGTSLSFTVAATSANNPAIASTQTETFTLPAVDGVTLTATPPRLSSVPGSPATATLTVRNVGNVAETVVLSSALPSGLALSGLGTVTLAAGAAQAVPVVLTPAAATPINTTLDATVTATFGPTAAPLTATAGVEVAVRSPAVVALSAAAGQAGAAGKGQLATTLSELADTFAQIESAPANALLFDQAQAQLGDLTTLLSADPALASLVAQLAPLTTAVAAHDAAGLLAAAPGFFGTLGNLLGQEASQQFTVSLSPGSVDVQPGQSQTLSLQLANLSNNPLSLALSAGALPAGVSVAPVSFATYDPSAQFSTTTNPGGAWTYGYERPLGAESSFTLDQFTPHFQGNPVVVAWQGSLAGDGNPSIAYNPTDQPLPFGGTSYIGPRGLLLHPGPGGEDSVLRFIAPANGTYQISAAFAAHDGGGTDVHVLRNGVSIFDGAVWPANNTASFTSSPLNLAAGDRIDFAVGYGADGSFLFDSTGLAVSIAAVIPQAGFGPTPVMLAPHQTLTLPVGVTQTLASAKVFTVNVAAAASLVQHTAAAVVSVRPAAADVLSVTVKPTAVNPGDPVTVSAQLADTANASREVIAHVDVLTQAGAVVASLPDVPVQFHPGSSPLTALLGSVPTASLAIGLYNVRVSLKTTDGRPLLGRSAQTPLLVGLPVTASVTAAPTIVAPGTSTVTTTINVANQVNVINSLGSSSNPNAIQLYYNIFAPGTYGAVRKVALTYDGTNVTLGAPVTAVSYVPGNGLVFAPSGDLYTVNGEVNPVTGGQVQTFPGGGPHLTLDPSGTKLWTSDDFYGRLEEVDPVNPSPPNPHTLLGDDPGVAAIAFDSAGNAYYTTGPSLHGPGVDCFGQIDLTTFTTHRIFSNLPAAIGLSFDPFTGDLILFGNNHITQIDPRTLTIVSDFAFTSFPVNFVPQGTVDGAGHLFVSDSNGHLVFMDYSRSRLVGAPGNFVAAPFVEANLDSVAVGPPAVATTSSGGSSGFPGLVVEVGYADNGRTNAFFPSPWSGSPNTVFVGNVAGGVNAGAIRIINNGSSPVTVNDVSVSLPGGQHFDLWGSNVVPAGASLILTQANGVYFDTADFPTLPFPQTYPDGETAHAPHIDLTVNGVRLPTLLDTGHVLTTGGSNLALQNISRALSWRPIGTVGAGTPGTLVSVDHNVPASGYDVGAASISLAGATVYSEFHAGDVFASIGNGVVNQFSANGTFVRSLHANPDTYLYATAFDAAGNLYEVGGSSNVVTKSDPYGRLLGAFGGGYRWPESIVFDAAGNVYVGMDGGGGNGGIRKFDSNGNFLGEILTGTRVDWMDLAADQTTLLYTNGGHDIQTVNAGTGAPGPNFTTGTLTAAQALRILPDGSVLVADADSVKRLDPAGRVIQTYNAPGESTWYSLNLDPGGTSFWGGNWYSGNAYKFDIASGRVLQTLSTILPGTQPSTLRGITVFSGITTPPLSANQVEEVLWQGALPPDGTPLQIQLSGQVTNMAPGETRQVSLGTSVVVQYMNDLGQILAVTIPLAPVVVTAQHIISLDSPTQTVPRAGTTTYNVLLTNPYPTAQTFTLSTDGLAGLTVGLAPSVTVGAGQSVSVPLTVAVPLNTVDGPRIFTVSAQTAGGVQDSVQGQVTVSPEVLLQSLGVHLDLAPAQGTAGQGTPAVYTVTLTNVGDAVDTYTLSGSFPPGFTASFSQPTVTVPPGQSNSRQVRLKLIPPPGTTPANYAFTVTATSTARSSVTSSAGATLTVYGQGVSVTLNPPSAAPGGSFQMTVTNTGQVTDTFNLALGGPGGLVATLGTTQVTLAAGASQVVMIATGAVNWADAGPLSLTAVATSQTHPAVQASATANLTIGTTQGLTAQFSPATQTLTQPGTASFLLLANNTGNTEDAYTATITGTTGTVTASLTGLDGLPTQTIPLFRLPGLSTGAILVPTGLTATGQGTVTVQVTSLNHPGITATATATLIFNPMVAPTNVALTPSPATINENQATTVSGSFTDPSPQATHTVVLSWGDGSANTTLNLTAGVLTFSASHTYTDNRPANAPYTVSATVTNSAGSASGTTQVTVLHVAPSNLVLAANPPTINEGGSTTLSGSFTAPGTLDTHAVVITWADGSPNTTVNLAPGVLTFSASHTYAAPAPYAVAVTVTDTEGGSTSGSTGVSVLNIAPGNVVLTASPVMINEGQATTLGGTFTDAGAADAHTVVISWGDGSANTTLNLAVGVLSFSGVSHTYTDNRPANAPYTVTATVSDNGGGVATGSTPVTVLHVAPSNLVLAANPATLNEGGSTTLSGSFTAPGTLDGHAVVITWADGSPNTTLNLAAGVLTFSASHTYLGVAPYAVGVTVTDTEGGSTSGGTTVTVLNIAPGNVVLTASPVTINEGQATTLGGTFTDQGAPDAHTVVLSWGDGSANTTLNLAAGALSFSGVSHIYTDNRPANAPYTVTATVSDNGGGVATGSTPVTVLHVAPSNLILAASPATISEGGSTTLSGSFTAPGTLDGHAVVIAWADSSANTTLNLAPGVLTFSASHTYAAPAPYAVAVSVTDTEGGSTSGSTGVSVLNIAPGNVVLTATPGTLSEGLPTTLGGTFTDAGAPDAHTVVISWGDGPATTTLNLAAGVLSFSGVSHTYLDERPGGGPYTVTATVSDNNGGSATGTTPITVQNAVPGNLALSLSAGATAAAAIGEGSSTTLSGTFTDPGTQDTHTAVIAWGDGSANTTLNLAAGVLTFSASHAYRDTPAGHPTGGCFPVAVTVTDDGGAAATAGTNVFVNNVAPSNVTLTATPATLNEGSATTLSGSFTDPAPLDTHTVTVSWGDGSANTTLPLAPGVLTFSGVSHTYLDERPGGAPYTVTATVADEDGAAGSGTTPVTVLNAAPGNLALALSAGGTAATALTEGGSTALSGSFTDPGTQDTHTAVITWGDGSANTTLNLAAGVLTFSATHAYRDTPAGHPTGGCFPVAVTVSDDGGAAATAATNVFVNNAVPANVTLTASPATINENQSTTLSGSFTDPAPLDTHTVVISWGDGSANTTVNLAAGVLTFSGVSHTYLDERPGGAPYTVTATVADEDGAAGTGTTQVTVLNAAPANLALTLSAGATAATALNEGSSTTLGGSFTDPGTLDTHAVVIAWGDGSANTTLSLAAHVLAFSASHVYRDNPAGHPSGGSFPVGVTVTDEGGAAATAGTNAFVNNVPPSTPVLHLSAGATAATAIGEGSSTTLSGTFTDPGVLDTHTVVIAWGDGSASTTLNLAANVLTFSASHAYGDNPAGHPSGGSFPVAVTVTDNDGGRSSASSAVFVNDVPPTVAPAAAQTPVVNQALSLQVATFTTPGFPNPTGGTPETFTASINWGDGTPATAGTVTVTQGSAGALTRGTVSGTHTYRQAAAFTVRVTVTDDDGGAGSATFGAQVLAHGATKFYVVDHSDTDSFRYDSAGNFVELKELSEDANDDPRGVASNAAGTTQWVIDANKRVYVYNADGSLRGSWLAAGLDRPEDITTNGTDVWIVDGHDANRVFHYAGAASRLSGSQAPDTSFALSAQQHSPTGLVLLGSTFWVTDDGHNDDDHGENGHNDGEGQRQPGSVFVYGLTGNYLGSWTLDPANDTPSGITLNPHGGTDLWVVDRSTAKVYHYAGATTRRSGSQAAADTFTLSADNRHPEGIADPPPLSDATPAGGGGGLAGSPVPVEALPVAGNVFGLQTAAPGPDVFPLAVSGASGQAPPVGLAGNGQQPAAEDYAWVVSDTLFAPDGPTEARRREFADPEGLSCLDDLASLAALDQALALTAAPGGQAQVHPATGSDPDGLAGDADTGRGI